MTDNSASDHLIMDGLATTGEHRAKKPYATPQLTAYGDIREITQTTTAGPPRNPDGQMDGFIAKRTNGAA